MTYNQIKGSADYIMAQTRIRPKIAIVLGTGISQITSEIEEVTRIPYKSIPRFGVSTVHEGVLYIGRLDGIPVAVMSGRMHCYEGNTMTQAAYPIAVLKALGVERLVLTNAAGGIDPSYSVGDFVLISDHIKFALDSPLRGENAGELGGSGRFFDMCDAYSVELRERVKAAVAASGGKIREGVYGFMSGPQFETPAEIRMLHMLGADLVGMSTVPEAIMAAGIGMSTVAVSVVTNMAAGVLNQPLTLDEINETGVVAAERFKKFLHLVVKTLEVK